MFNYILLLFSTYFVGAHLTKSIVNGTANEKQLLFEAVKDGNEEVLKWMLTKGANIDSKDALGRTLLAESIQISDNLNMTKFLINNGANLENQDEDGRSALLVAASLGKTNNFIYLLEKGANVNVTDKRGRNAAHLAAANGSSDILKALGKDLHDMINLTDDYGKKPIWYAAEGGNINAFALLKTRSSVIEPPDTLVAGVSGGNLDIVKSLIMEGQNVNTKNQSGASILQMACDNHKDNVAKYLIDEGADLSIKDDDGRNLLHLCSASGSDQIVSILLSKGLEVDAVDVHGNTALHYAAANDKEDVIKTLLKNKADISTRNNHGESPVESAVKSNSLASLIFFTKEGYGINQINTENKTLCHIATNRGSATAVKLMLEQGANCDGKDSYGNYPIHYAVDNQLALKNLLEAGVNPEVQDRDGKTPLVLAAERGNTKSAICLLKFGANPTGTMLPSFPDDRYYAYVQNSPIRVSRENINKVIEQLKNGEIEPKDIEC